MPRVKLFDEEKAIQKAMELFWEKGFQSTSLSDLTEHLGIGKGSFYATFKSKEVLFDLCFNTYQSANVPLIEQLLASETDRKKGLKKLMAFNVDFLLGNPSYKGCFIANSCSEVSEDKSDLTTKISQHYLELQRIIQKYLTSGGITSKRAKCLAAMSVTFLIGMSQQSKINQDRNSYLDSIEEVVSLLD